MSRTCFQYRPSSAESTSKTHLAAERQSLCSILNYILDGPSALLISLPSSGTSSSFSDARCSPHSHTSRLPHPGTSALRSARQYPTIQIPPRKRPTHAMRPTVPTPSNLLTDTSSDLAPAQAEIGQLPTWKVWKILGSNWPCPLEAAELWRIAKSNGWATDELAQKKVCGRASSHG